MNRESLAIWWETIVEWAATSSLFRIALILSFALLGLYGAKVLAHRLYALLIWRHGDDPEIQKRGRTLSSFVRYTVVTVVIAISSITILREVGIDIRPILTGAGIVGLAVGFGAQNLVQDVISGIFMLLEDQVRVGDVVNLKGKGGLVEKISLRTIQLRDLDGSVHYVRNGQIDIVTNMTKGFSNYVIEFGVAYHTNIDQALQIFRDVDEEMRADPKFKEDILKPLDVYGIERLADSAVILRARTTTKPLRQWDVGREFLRRIKDRFDAAGIEIPFPQRTMNFPPELIEALVARKAEPPAPLEEKRTVEKPA